MAFIPENRMEQILAGENITPENRDEAFAKEAIDNAGSGGGGSLPDMTGQSGKFLTNNGTVASWADVGGELAFVLTVGESVSCDVPVADIVAALEAKRPVFGTAGELGELIVKNWSPELNKVVLYLYMPDDDVLRVVEFIGTSGTPDTWTYDAPKVVNGLLPVTGTNNGQVFGVNNGAYALLDPKYPLIVHGTADLTNGTAEITDDINISDIVSAFTADRTVYFQATLGEGYYVRLGLFQAIGNELTFSAPDITGNAATVYTCEFDNSKTGTFNHAP